MAIPPPPPSRGARRHAGSAAGTWAGRPGPSIWRIFGSIGGGSGAHRIRGPSSGCTVCDPGKDQRPSGGPPSQGVHHGHSPSQPSSWRPSSRSTLILTLPCLRPFRYRHHRPPPPSADVFWCQTVWAPAPSLALAPRFSPNAPRLLVTGRRCRRGAPAPRYHPTGWAPPPASCWCLLRLDRAGLPRRLVFGRRRRRGALAIPLPCYRLGAAPLCLSTLAPRGSRRPSPATSG